MEYAKCVECRRDRRERLGHRRLRFIRYDGESVCLRCIKSIVARRQK